MNIKLRVVNEGEHKGKVVLHTSGYGSSLLADGQTVPSTINGWFNPAQVEFREFTDEPVRREEVVREVRVEIPVEKALTEEENNALHVGLSLLDSARALKRISNARRELRLAIEDGQQARRDAATDAEIMLEAAGLGDVLDVLKELATEMGLNDDDDEVSGAAECPDCGEEEFLNPESGICFGCEANEADDEAEVLCRECEDLTSACDLINGLCDDCYDESLDDEDEEDEEDEEEE